MNRFVSNTTVAVAVLLACTPTEPCACTPARTSLVIYGQVRTAAGTPAAGASLHFFLAPPAAAQANSNPCAFDLSANDADPNQDRADSGGSFRTVIYSVFSPGTRCLRVTAFQGNGSTTSDSARVDGLLVPFRLAQPDSIGIVLTLQ